MIRRRTVGGETSAASTAIGGSLNGLAREDDAIGADRCARDVVAPKDAVALFEYGEVELRLRVSA